MTRWNAIGTGVGFAALAVILVVGSYSATDGGHTVVWGGLFMAGIGFIAKGLAWEKPGTEVFTNLQTPNGKRQRRR